MLTAAAPVALLVAQLVVAQAPASEAGESIAVMEMRPAAPADASAAALLGDALVVAVGAEHKGAVTSLREIRERVGAQAEARLLGCDDETCVADASKGLATDLIIVGRAGVMNGQLLVFLSLIDTRTGAVRARASQAVPVGAAAARAMSAAAAAGSALLGKEASVKTVVDGAARQSARALLVPDALRDGDQALKDLRIAVLFDEYGADGQPAKTRPVETCVQKRLMDAEASLVSAAVVSRIKGKAGPRKLLEGGVPEDLTGDEVDVFVVGAVERTPMKLGDVVTGTELAASVQLMRADSGDVIASENVNARYPSSSPTEAVAKAAEKVCTKLEPALAAALQRRAARGTRVVVELSGGEMSPDIASGAARKLDGLQRVARALVKRVDAKKATLDVVLKGGDGIAFALDAGALLAVTEASAGSVKGTLR